MRGTDRWCRRSVATPTSSHVGDRDARASSRRSPLAIAGHGVGRPLLPAPTGMRPRPVIRRTPLSTPESDRPDRRSERSTGPPLHEVARQRHRPATLDHTVIRRRRSNGDHVSRYWERQRRSSLTKVTDSAPTAARDAAVRSVRQAVARPSRRISSTVVKRLSKSSPAPVRIASAKLGNCSGSTAGG